MATTTGLHGMLGDLDRTLRALYARELEGGGLSGTEISFEAPTVEWSAALKGPTLDLYLYDIRESRRERQVEWQHGQSNGHAVERPPPVLIEAAYAVTAWADSSESEHELLSAALAVGHAYPELPADIRQGALAEGWALEFPLVAQVAQPAERGDGFWAAVGGRHKASVDLVVGVWCQRGREVEQAPPVRTQTLRMASRGRPAAGVEELHRVSGSVREKGGGPAAGAWVVLPDIGGFAVADPDGRFTLGSLPAGRHRLLARGAGGGEASADVNVPGPSAELKLS
jgi:Pvc16 N-terminal domain/Carboxypeptidase regulatory-like domain